MNCQGFTEYHYCWKCNPRLVRYSFLHCFRLRNDAEEEEIQRLRRELTELGQLPEWPFVEREHV